MLNLATWVAAKRNGSTVGVGSSLSNSASFENQQQRLPESPKFGNYGAHQGQQPGTQSSSPLQTKSSSLRNSGFQPFSSYNMRENEVDADQGGMGSVLQPRFESHALPLSSQLPTSPNRTNISLLDESLYPTDKWTLPSIPKLETEMTSSVSDDWSLAFKQESPTTLKTPKYANTSSDYFRPTTSDIAKDGLLWFNEAGTWTQYFAIATYQHTNGLGILHFYQNEDDMVPHHVVDLSDLSAISPSNCPNPYLQSRSEFTLSFGENQVTLGASAVMERSSWIMTLSLMINKKYQDQNKNESGYTSNNDPMFALDEFTTKLSNAEQEIAELRARMEVLETENEILRETNVKLQQQDNDGGLSIVSRFDSIKLPSDMDGKSNSIAHSMHSHARDMLKQLASYVDDPSSVSSDLMSTIAMTSAVQLLKSLASFRNDQVFTNSLSQNLQTLLDSIVGPEQTNSKISVETCMHDLIEKVDGMMRASQSIVSLPETLGTLSTTVTSINEALQVRSRATSSTSSSVCSDELTQAKLDNVLEVIDFVNKSQCRLVSLMTEKFKAPPQGHETQSLELLQTIQKSQHESTEEFRKLQTDVITKINMLQQVLSESRVNVESGDHAKLTTLLWPLKQLQTTLDQIDSQTARCNRDAKTRHDELELWMSRNYELLKHVHKGVKEFEKHERNQDVEKSLSPSKVKRAAESGIFETYESRVEISQTIQELASAVKKLSEERELLGGFVQTLQSEKESIQQSAFNKILKEGMEAKMALMEELEELEKELVTLPEKVKLQNLTK